MEERGKWEERKFPPNRRWLAALGFSSFPWAGLVPNLSCVFLRLTKREQTLGGYDIDKTELEERKENNPNTSRMISDSTLGRSENKTEEAAVTEGAKGRPNEPGETCKNCWPFPFLPLLSVLENKP